MIHLLKRPMNVMRSELEGGRRSKNRTNGKNKKKPAKYSYFAGFSLLIFVGMKS